VDATAFTRILDAATAVAANVTTTTDVNDVVTIGANDDAATNDDNSIAGVNIGGGSTTLAGIAGGNSGAGNVLSSVQLLNTYFGPLPVPSFNAFVTLHRIILFGLESTGLVEGLERAEAFLGGFNHARFCQSLFALLLLLGTHFSFLSFFLGLGNLPFLGRLAFAPDVPAVRRMIDHLNRTHSLFNTVDVKVYDDEAGAVADALDTTNFRDRTWAVIVLDEFDVSTGVVECR
jgi:hypothetical protein